MFSLIDITPQPVPNLTEYPPEAFRVSLEDGTIGQEILKGLNSDRMTIAVLAVLDENGDPIGGLSHYCSPSSPTGQLAWIHLLRTEDVEAQNRANMTMTDPAYPTHLNVAYVMVQTPTGDLSLSRKDELANCSLILNIQPRDRRHV